jgi:hypothetical protein
MQNFKTRSVIFRRIFLIWNVFFYNRLIHRTLPIFDGLNGRVSEQSFDLLRLEVLEERRQEAFQLRQILLEF